MRASTLAGLAFGNADVAGVHCLSEAAGGQFDVPHGLTNAILLTPVLRHQLEEARGRLAELDRQVLGGGGSAEAFLDALDRLSHAVAIPGWDALNIPAAAFDELARKAEENNSNGSNPRDMRAADYRAILERVAAA